jgi:hypothetical protein
VKRAVATGIITVIVLASGCARVYVRQAALEQLAASVAAGVANQSGQSRQSNGSCHR